MIAAVDFLDTTLSLSVIGGERYQAYYIMTPSVNCSLAMKRFMAAQITDNKSLHLLLVSVQLNDSDDAKQEPTSIHRLLNMDDFMFLLDHRQHRETQQGKKRISVAEYVQHAANIIPKESGAH